jgi:hypothetical protein
MHEQFALADPTSAIDDDQFRAVGGQGALDRCKFHLAINEAPGHYSHPFALH